MGERFAESLRGRKNRSGGWTNSAQEQENYDAYRLSPKEWILYAGVILGLGLLVSLVFFNTILPALVLTIPCIFLLKKRHVKKKAEKRKTRFLKEFLSAIGILGDAMKAGQSPESAIEGSLPELKELWGERSDIAREWKRMVTGLQMSMTVEELFADLGKRTGLKEVRLFAELFATVKRSGGQLSRVIKDSADRLSAAFETEEQIRLSTAAKRFEQRIMNVMPLGILLYVRIASPDLVAPLYGTLAGRLVMVGALLAYVVAIALGERILKIRM